MNFKAMYLVFFLIGFQLFACVKANSNGLSTGTCTFARSTTSSYTSYYTSYYTVQQHSTYGCGFLWLSRCSRYHTRYVYQILSTATYYITYYTHTDCCTGYSRINGVCTPQCTQGCVYGTCTSPATCTCNSGWTGSNCYSDINECSVNNGGCDHGCTNSLGSFTCSCYNGFYLSSNQRNCIDVDECTNGDVVIGGNETNSTDDGWCQQRCINTPGGYECGCYTGYSLDTNNQTCTDIDECASNNGGCNQMCNNSIGWYNCSCYDGYVLLEDDHTCADHCDCCNATDNDCEQICTDIEGSYNCSCFNGFRVSSDNSSKCEDINECTENTSNCTHICTNTVGSYNCSCYDGYHLLFDGFTCQDTNECNSNNGNCEQICINKQGSYECQCLHGYMLNQDNMSSCDNIDECATNSSNCSQLCYDQDGSYYCGCEMGFVMESDNHTCSDIDECLTSNGGCTHNCINNNGSYTCTCDPGYDAINHQCIARSCPQILTPTNGDMNCTGEQVTDESCIFTCHSGYNLTGSHVRTCLPDGSWSGLTSLCPPSRCPSLSLANNSIALYPCDEKYKDACQLVCQVGYVLEDSTNDITWSQTCDLVNGSAVDWNITQECSIKSLCVPNPCGRGVCSVVNGEVNCDCEGTYAHGDRCQLHYMTVESIPLLTSGDTHTIRVASRPFNPVKVLVTSSDNDSLAIVGSPVVTLTTNGAEYTVVARRPGVYSINYTIMALPTQFISPEETIIAVSANRPDRSAEDYFGTLGLPNGQLGVGCCSHKMNLNPHQCVSNITLQSSCQWSLDRNGLIASEGVVFLSINALHLPLSIAGLRYNSSDLSSFQINPPTNSCLSCRNCLSFTKFGVNNVHSLLRYDSMLFTLLSSINSFLPSWLTLEIYSNTEVYSHHNYMASVDSPTRLSGCSILHHTMQQASLRYLLSTTSQLLLHVDSRPFIVIPTEASPFCFVLDICSDRHPILHATVPSSLERSSDTARLLMGLLQDDGMIDFKSISFQENGLYQVPYMDKEKYWNGTHHFDPVLPNYFEYMLTVNFTRTFTGDQLRVMASFNGQAYYQSNISRGKVPGMLIGLLTLNILTTINNKRVNLQLTTSDPVIYSYPGTRAAQMAGLSTGLSGVFKLSGDVYLGDVSIRGSSKCDVRAFLSLNDNFQVNSISMSTDCMKMSIGGGVIGDEFHHNLFFAGLTKPVPFKSLIIRSQLISSPRYKLNNFMTITDENAIKLTYDRSTGSAYIHMESLNVTFLNSALTLTINTTEPNSFVFMNDTKIFTNFDTRVLGRLTSALALELDGEFLERQGSFRSSISAYISQHLLTEVNSIVRKSQRANDSILMSVQWKDKLNLFLRQQNETLTQMNQAYLEANESYTNLTISIDQIHKEITANDTLYSAFTSICGVTCSNICIAGPTCQSAFKSNLFRVATLCVMKELTNQTVRTSKVEVKKKWRQQQSCNYCWKFTWYKSLYLSQDSCCINIKDPVNTKSQVYQYSQKEVNTTIRNSCTTAIFNEATIDIGCKSINDCIAICKMNCSEDILVNNDFPLIFVSYINQTKALRDMRIDLQKKQFSLNQKKKEFSLLEMLHSIAEESHQINLQTNNETIIRETDVFLPFIGTPGTNPISFTNPLSITNVSFNLLLANVTPVEFPVKVEYYDSLRGESDYINVSVNFLQPRKYILRQISNAILESYINKHQQHQAVKRQTTDDSNPVHYFHDTCIELKNIKYYVRQILTSLNDSFSSYNTSKLMLLDMTESGDNTSNSYMNILEDNSFGLWQSQMEKVHINSSQVEPFDCHSFMVCMENVLKNFQHILEDTREGPSITGAINGLASMKENILKVAYDKRFTYKKALLALEWFLNVLDTPAVLSYWCVHPPVVFNEFPPNVTVKESSSIHLSCQINSTFNITHYWVKDANILPFTDASFINLSNVQGLDGGEYHCVAVNDAGSSRSLPVTVEVVVLPQFNETLPPYVNAQERDANDVHLRCDSVGSPAPGWEWSYRQNENDNWHIMQGASSNVLTIRNPRFKDRGWYRCALYNDTTTINGPPTFLNVLPSAFVNLGYNLVVDIATTPLVDDMGGSILDDVLQNVVTLANADHPIGNKYARKLSNIWSLHFSIQTSSIISSANVTTAKSMMNSRIDSLERDKDSLSSLLVGRNTRELSPVYVNGLSHSVTLTSINISPRNFLCPSGYELSSNRLYCVACSPGNYDGEMSIAEFTDGGDGSIIEESVPRCLKCPIGSYQESSGQTQCLQCPTNYSTLTEGSTALIQCKELCPPHTFSSTGFVPCIPCPLSHYQLHLGQRLCSICTDKTTVDICNTVTTSVTSPSITNGHVNTTSNSMNLIMISGGFGALVVLLLLAICIVIVVLFVIRKRRNKRMFAVQRNILEMSNAYEGSRPQSIVDADDKKSNVESCCAIEEDVDLPITDKDPVYESLDDYTMATGSTFVSLPVPLPPRVTTAANEDTANEEDYEYMASRRRSTSSIDPYTLIN